MGYKYKTNRSFKYFLIFIPIKQNKDSYKINISFFKNIFCMINISLLLFNLMKIK